MTLEQLILQRKQSQAKRNRKLTKDERKRQVRDWCTFYRRNWNIYARSRLGINLKPFQEIMLYFLGISNVFYMMCGRGLSKTFMSALAAFIKCLLYPHSEVVLTATTIKTAKKMVKEKMEGELCGRFSPVLHWMYINGLIKFSYNEEEIKVDFVFNGSWIKVLPQVDSSRGERSNMLLFEEARLLKKAMVDSVFLPMRHARVPAYRLLPEYEKDPRLVERAQIIYLTSTRYKHEWFWNAWKVCVNNFFGSSRLIYNIFAGDIITAIYHDFMTEEDFDIAKQESSDAEIAMEYYNEPLGEVEGSFYSLQLFNDNRVIKHKNAFVPPTTEEYVIKYSRGEFPWFRDKRKDELRTLFIDFAFTDTTSDAKDSDNTVIGCMSGFPNGDRTRILRNAEYMETYSGGQKDETLLRIRELVYYYDVDVILLDTRNGGEDRWQELSKPYYHEELGLQFNGLGIYDDDSVISFFCDRAKADNLRNRTVDPNALKMVIPVIGTEERNNNYHLAMKSALQHKIIRFLEDEMSAKESMQESGEYATWDSNRRMRELLGHVQYDIMILNEAIKLQQVIRKGFVSLVVSGRNKRDRIVACEYANYFFHLKELEMIKEQMTPEYDVSEWKLWG